MQNQTPLPIDEALPEFLARLEEGRNVVLEAPPGAGKTTRAPLAIYEHATWRGDGVILMLEPRRVAARAAAERLASNLGEPVGQHVGYRIRHESKTSAATRIEVVTEGVLTRRLQRDPELSGVAAILFDEIHERSLHADLGLALCLESQVALRPDLRLVAMSATLDGAKIANVMDAAIVTSAGRSFDVETRWRATPLSKEDRGRGRFERIVAQTAADALNQEVGDALIFLPGAREIRQAETELRALLGGAVDVFPLYGDLPFAQQNDAITPSPGGRRKAVIATNIAETSLTIDGVRIVIDAGRSRRARFDPTVGMNRLSTGPVSRAAAAQRRGRAGRTAPGVCFRLWSKGEEGALPAYDAPEIMESDLSGLALELAAWGAAPEGLAFIDQPPTDAYEQAVELLKLLGALDRAGRITPHGQVLAAAPLHPRLAHMAITSGSERAMRLAALLEERDPLRGETSDIDARLKALDNPSARPQAKAALSRIRRNASEIQNRLKPQRQTSDLSSGAILALAYPDRIGQRRQQDEQALKRGKPARYLMSNGRGAELSADDPLCKAPFLVAASLSFPQDASRSGGDPRITLAGALDRSEIEALFEPQIIDKRRCEWSKRDAQVLAFRERRLGALTLDQEKWADAPDEALIEAMLDGVRKLGLESLPWSNAAKRLKNRVERARNAIDALKTTLPDFSDDGLLRDLAEWLGPYLSGIRRRADLERLDLHAILKSRLDYAAETALNQALPARYTTPHGDDAPIDYAGDQPKISIRLQALFGVKHHPVIAGQPLLIELLSPAQRPIQLTADLPGFWAGSYADVRKDMRARYPKHPWPENPAEASPPPHKPRR